MYRQSHAGGLCVAVLAVLLLVALGGGAYGQPVAELTADPGSFMESYDSAVPVSGSTVVGVRLGEADGTVAVRDTQLALLPTDEICVRSVTRDGRFSANNIYKLSSPASNRDRARLSPVTLSYAHELSAYKKDDFAVAAFTAQGGSCQPSEAIYLPELANPQRPWQHLTILINSGARYSVLIVDKSQQKVLCQRIAQGPLIVYDQKCQVVADLLSEGINDFTLVMDDGFGDESVPFQVMLPSPSH